MTSLAQPLLTFLGTVLAAACLFYVAYRKMRPEIEAITTRTALDLAKSLSDEIAVLRERILQLEARDEAKALRIDELEDGVRALHEQIRQLGHNPIWPPAAARRTHQGD